MEMRGTEKERSGEDRRGGAKGCRLNGGPERKGGFGECPTIR